MLTFTLKWVGDFIEGTGRKKLRYCTWYRQKGRSKLKFTNEAADIKPVELKSVSTVVKLSYDPNTNTFTLAQEDREVRDHVYNGG